MSDTPAEGPVPHGAGPSGIPDGLEPLGTWGLTTIRNFSPEQHVEMCHWHERRIGRLNDTWRVEFYLLDAPFAVAFRYAVDADGRKYQDPATGLAATEPPAIVPLSELPPDHLLAA